MASLVEIDNEAFAFDGIEERSSVPALQTWLERDEHLDPHRDILFAKVAGERVGYTVGAWENDNDGGRNYWVWGQVMPGWRRRSSISAQNAGSASRRSRSMSCP